MIELIQTNPDFALAAVATIVIAWAVELVLV